MVLYILQEYCSVFPFPSSIFPCTATHLLSHHVCHHSNQVQLEMQKVWNHPCHQGQEGDLCQETQGGETEKRSVFQGNLNALFQQEETIRAAAMAGPSHQVNV